MLYADVIVRQRSKVEELTYAVPATMVAYIRSGSPVTIPLRRRKVQGIVVALRRNVAKTLAPKIKEILALERDRRVTEAEVAAMRRLADYYGASLSEVAFHALNRPIVADHSGAVQATSRPLFFQADVWQRAQAYARLIRAHPSRSCVIICATQGFADFFQAQLDSEGVGAVEAEKTVRFTRQIEQRRAMTVIGTLGDVFLPLRPGDILIIDQPYHIGLKSQQRPYMRAQTIASIRQAVEGLRVVFGDDLIGLEDMERVRKGELRFQSMRSPAPAPTVLSRVGSGDVLLPSFVEGLRETVSAGGTALVIALARGWASAAVCRECGFIAACPQCAHTLAVANDQLVCHLCGYQRQPDRRCPACGSHELHEIGEGVARVRSELQRALNQAVITELSSDRPQPEKADIIVATEKILSFPEQRFSLVAVASADRLASGVGLDDHWELIRLLKLLGSRAERLLIQTYLPESDAWTATSDVRSFFARELSERKRAGVRPYATQVELVSTGVSAEALRREADGLARQLRPIIRLALVGVPVLSKAPAGQWRIALPILLPTSGSRYKRLIADLLGPAWHLDVEPLAA